MCTAENLDHVLKTTQVGLREIFGSKLLDVLLYGSYARGEQDAESDIDIFALVDMKKDELTQYRRTVSDFSSKIDLDYNVLLSIKLQDAETFQRYREELPFFCNVIKDGVHIVQ